MILVYDRIIRETDLAVLFDFGDEELWVPESVIESCDGDEGNEVEIKDWFVLDKGLERYEGTAGAKNKKEVSLKKSGMSVEVLVRLKMDPVDFKKIGDILYEAAEEIAERKTLESFRMGVGENSFEVAVKVV